MKFGKLGWVAALSVMTSVCITGPVFASTSPTSNSLTTTIHGEMLGLLSQATLLGHVSSQTVIHLSVAMQIQNQQQMRQFVASLYDPKSPNYKHFLKAGEFANQFGPSVADYNSVVSFLKSNGFTIEQTYSNRLLIDVSAPVRTVEQVLHVQLNNYSYRGQQFRATNADVVLPIGVAQFVQGVLGLNTFATMHSHLTLKANTTPFAATATSGYTPQQIHTAYDYNPLYNASITGSGQTIAIATANTYSSSDVAAFDSAFGIASPNVTNVNVDGTPTQTDPETTLDLEWSHATAPAANVIMYQGANASLTTFTDVYNKIATDDLASVVSTSWGTSEDNMSTTTLNADDTIFAQMAAQGQSMFAASGDNGATDGQSYLSTDYPSIDPYVTACGGTSLTLGSNNSYGSETAWSGSGGGESDYFSEPSWQTGTNVTQDGWRQSPDIALNADPNTGYSYYFNGAWGVAGGTSFVAPQMTATFALVNQDRANNGLGNIGQADAAVYPLAANAYSDFHDVTSGNNGYYSAGPNYDNVTGWGSIDANLFVSGLS